MICAVIVWCRVGMLRGILVYLDLDLGLHTVGIGTRISKF